MPMLNLKLDGDQCWPDLKDLPEGMLITPSESIDVAMLAGGMSSGATSVAFRFNLPDGRVVIAQTSLFLLESAVRAFRGREAFLADLKARGGQES